MPWMALKVKTSTLNLETNWIQCSSWSKSITQYVIPLLQELHWIPVLGVWIIVCATAFYTSWSFWTRAAPCRHYNSLIWKWLLLPSSRIFFLLTLVYNYTTKREKYRKWQEELCSMKGEILNLLNAFESLKATLADTWWQHMSDNLKKFRFFF